MDSSEPALRAAAFLEGHHVAWDRHLQTFGQAHWHILTFVRSCGEEGANVRQIFAHLMGVFGMDRSTAAKRLRELIERDFLVGDSDTITRTTVISATPAFTARFDAYCVELANVMIGLSYTDVIGPIVNGPGSRELSDTVHGFFAEFGAKARPSIERYLRLNIANPARRDRAGRSLPSFGYWRLIYLCWSARASAKTFVYLDDLHVALYPALRKSPDTTRQMVTELIEWSFLERLGRADGPAKNRFAVRISEPAFILYKAVFEAAYQMMVETAGRIVQRAGAEPHPATVIPIKRRMPKTIAESESGNSSLETG